MSAVVGEGDYWASILEPGLSDHGDREAILRTLALLAEEERLPALDGVFWELLPALMPLVSSEDDEVAGASKLAVQLVGKWGNPREVPLAALALVDEYPEPEQLSIIMGVAGVALARLEMASQRTKLVPDLTRCVLQCVDNVEPPERAHELVYEFIAPLFPVVTADGPTQMRLFATLVGLALKALAALSQAPGDGKTGFLEQELTAPDSGNPAVGGFIEREAPVPPLALLLLQHPQLGLTYLLHQVRRDAFVAWTRDRAPAGDMSSSERLDVLAVTGDIPWSMQGVAQIAGVCACSKATLWIPQTLSPRERFFMLIVPAILLLPNEGACMSFHALWQGLQLAVAATACIPELQLSESEDQGMYLLRHQYVQNSTAAPEWADCLPDAMDVITALLSGLMMCPSESLRRTGLRSLRAAISTVHPRARLNLLKAAISEFPVPNARAVLTDIFREQMAEALRLHDLDRPDIASCFLENDVGHFLVDQIELYSDQESRDNYMLHRDSDATCALIAAWTFAVAATATDGIASKADCLWGVRQANAWERAGAALRLLRKWIRTALENWEYERVAPAPEPPKNGPQHFGKPIRPPQDIFRLNLLDSAAERALSLIT